MSEVMLYSTDYFVWINETGSDNRDHIRKFGYKLRGFPPIP